MAFFLRIKLVPLIYTYNYKKQVGEGGSGGRKKSKPLPLCRYDLTAIPPPAKKKRIKEAKMYETTFYNTYHSI